MLAGSALVVAATLTSWLALVTVGTLHVAGVPLGPGVQAACAAVAGPLAIVALVRGVASVWRGPPVIAFERPDAVACRPHEAEAIRAKAQLRGTMGGAGHVHPVRLAFPLLSWAGAIVGGVQGAVAAGLVAEPWPIALALGAALSAWLFPSRPFWYREVTGGGVVVTPPATAAIILARSPSSNAVEVGPNPGA